jgi:hypothetical protein
MKLGRWSPAAGSNNEAVPDGWPEGQLPSTVNDCAREMMAAIRTAALDFQFIDQGLSPTYLTASSFSVPGNQTSAIHIGRRLKIFDATAGVQQIIYATVNSVSFTAVTTIHIEADSGSLTSSLSSFGLSIISNVNNSLPRDSDMTISSLAVTGGMSVSGASALNGQVAMAAGCSVSGALVCNSTLSVSATATAAVFKSTNAAKAWIFAGILSSNPITVRSSFNISSISRSATGVVRLTFSLSMADALYMTTLTCFGFGGSVGFSSLSQTATTCKFTILNTLNEPTDGVWINATFYR